MGRPSTPYFNTSKDIWYSTIDGELCYLAKGRKNKDEAHRKFHRLKADAEERRRRGPGITLVALCDIFMDRCIRDLSPVTCETYKWTFRLLIAHVGREIQAEEIQPHHITAWADGPGATRASIATRYNRIGAAKAVMAWAHREGHIGTNPIARMSRPTPGGRTAIMTEAQADRLMATVRCPRFRDLLVILRETGCRPSEAMKLEASMLDVTRGVAVMDSKTTRTTGRRRVIHLNDAAMEVCRRLAAEHPEGPLLRNRDGRGWKQSTLSHRFRHLRKVLGFGPEATAESFRHQFATVALAAGVPIEAVSKLMGHANTAMVSRTYSHLQMHPEYLKAELARARGDQSKC